MTTGGKKDSKIETAIAALLTSTTIAEAAKAIGISEQTLWRWKQEPEFKKQYRQVKMQVVTQATTQLQSATGKAVKTLKDIMEDEKTPANARVTAARAILEYSYKGTEMQDMQTAMEEMAEQLEVLLEAKGK